MSVLDQTKPHQKYFEAICAIPHPSTGEKAVSDYVCSVAKKLGLDFEQDHMWNVIVRKPASSGYENSPTVMLQAHLDMVCVKSPDSDHVFETDPLKLFVDEKGNVRAEGTTLGADDGYGVAYLLALMEENDYPHPPLELVFTSQEENGCYGAAALDTDKLTARRMIGLDVMGETYEWVSTVSCFSSDLVVVTKDADRFDCDKNGLKINISGLQPVYSETMVHPEQFNAVKIVGRILYTLRECGVDYRLSSMNGGVAENYPPVEIETVISLDGAQKSDAVKLIEKEFEIIKKELDDGKQEFKLEINDALVSSEIGSSETADIVNLIYLMPSNHFTLKPSSGSMTSVNNIGMVEFGEDKKFTLTMSNRNESSDYKKNVNNRIKLISELCGCKTDISSRYEPWEYAPDSYMRNLTADLMREFYGHEMDEEICPGGLEACNFLPKMPGLDIVMFAPVGQFCHTTAEYLNLESFDKVYRFVKLLLERLK